MSGTVPDMDASMSGALESEPSGMLGEEPLPPNGTCDEKFWSCPGHAGFKVRGPRYLRDHQKARLLLPRPCTAA